MRPRPTPSVLQGNISRSNKADLVCADHHNLATTPTRRLKATPIRPNLAMVISSRRRNNNMGIRYEPSGTYSTPP